MKPTALSQIAAWCNGTLTVSAAAHKTVSIVSTDSRAVKGGELFIALKGETFDAHTFIEQVAAAGVAAAVVHEEVAAPAEFPLIRVKDTLAALQQIAASYRETLQIPVIAVGGSNGKTSTKELVYSAISCAHRPTRTLGNLNNHIGVPLTLLAIEPEHTAAVIEVGTNHPGEIAQLTALVKPQVAIITNIGQEHLEFLKDEAGVAQEEGALIEALEASGTAILNADDEWTALLEKRTRAKLIKTGFSASARLRISDFVSTTEGIRFIATAGAESACISIPLHGEHMAVNASLALAAGQALGLSLTDMARTLPQVQVPGARMRVFEKNGFRIFDDCYNANPSSMRAALSTLGQEKRRRIAVLGTMGELGEEASRYHREIGAAARAADAEVLLAVGAYAAEYASGAGSICSTAADVNEAADFLKKRLLPGDALLVKASRSARFERILEQLGLALNSNGGGH